MQRFSDPTVFLKLEVSWVLAASPMARTLGPKATSDLFQNQSALCSASSYTSSRPRTAFGDWRPRW
jgi:hypothetical protein